MCLQVLWRLTRHDRDREGGRVVAVSGTGSGFTGCEADDGGCKGRRAEGPRRRMRYEQVNSKTRGREQEVNRCGKQFRHGRGESS